MSESVARRGLVLPVVLAGTFMASYPRLLPQVTRMTTGKPPDDPEFVADWESFSKHIGRLVN